MKKDLIGKVYGYWQVLEKVDNTYLRCLCLGCNQTTKLVGRSNLVSGKSTSCGCKLVEAMKKTNKERYGVEYASQSAEILSKQKDTNLQRYGVENIQKNKEVREKTKRTLEEKYNVSCYSKTEEWKEKVKATSLEKFGEEHYAKTKEWKERIVKTNQEKYGVDHNIIINHSSKKKKKKYGSAKYSKGRQLLGSGLVYGSILLSKEDE